MRTSRWRVVVYSLVLLTGFLTALPNLFTPAQLADWPSFLPTRQVALGLDLRGGSHLVLEIDTAAMIAERLEITRDDVTTALRKAHIDVNSIQISNDQVIVSLSDTKDHDGALDALEYLANAQVETPRHGSTAEFVITAPSDNSIHIALSEQGIRNRVDASAQQSLEIIRSRIDQIGVSEPTIQRIGSDRVLVQLPGVQDPSQVRKLLGSTAKLGFYMLADRSRTDKRDSSVLTLQDKDGQSYHLHRTPALSGDHLTDAHAGFDPQSHQPVVNFRFDTAGAAKFADITRANVGKPFAIVLDNEVLSAPVIREAITGGSGQISGSFTVGETVTLSALLRAGSLPAPMTVIEERTVGPDLGADAIEMGLYTGLIGLGLVTGLMFFLYGRWGMIANLALGLNVMLTFGALSLMGATLTLPGIAGIVLGIGLAVDANVLINERIREETKRGLSAFMALDSGFKRAYATIVDSNITTLIATALLFEFGSGPVRGFAITMGLGIVISMFTAVAVVRVIMTEIVWRTRMKKLVIEPLWRFMPEKTSISFMRARFLGIGMSLLLSAISIGLFFKPGLDYGVDFKGGIQVEVASSSANDGNSPLDLGALRQELSTLGLGDVSLQDIGKDGHILIRVERQPGGEQAQTAAVETVKKAVQSIDPAADFERTEVVGPKVSGELAQSGVSAVIFASLAMLCYIWWRFEWPFAVGAIVTLILDVTKTIGFFAIMGLDFNLTAIAALLTLIGYSVNDKVVVYDRMRENLRLYRKMPMREIIDMSINQSLARCLFTSLTTLFAMVPMAIWGGSAVESFAVPMVFGVVIATTSSIYIAAPILLFLDTWRQKQRQKHARLASETDIDDNPLIKKASS
ncbi:MULTISPECIES: protein translocase subunit SecD [Thalassospira]|jgi:SecD/SecF fusion protein|uniref:Multifunctional fusion protein n=1 Tax=Thalassospira xiamenensis TaxID=220697 RepID=A0ABR5XYK0_9PROT|nr:MULTISPECIES: protein translocase subunit SecD [Thalassospira]MBL4843729.1 protein translocase subunit SecD [Thalassospira sp.]MBR9778891.1 protein translocase subunit SecD [Rhodospirillales bacterium]KZC97102.1 preprotein translocase subunit SecD [Thalassospira xiamenensis]KZD08028.1 preprotein translocase subunit SecD [Thalassospira xiamenensis]MBR9818314.1 protein translocase subunit SecD [Rhodospirillales bacterium]|tara:strand:- start:41150 stop:43726 length:2577 start_codon:yes stop_codon:yes gene_type:complete